MEYYLFKLFTDDETIIYIGRTEGEVDQQIQRQQVRDSLLGGRSGSYWSQPIFSLLTPRNKDYVIFGTTFHDGRYRYFIWSFKDNTLIYKGNDMERTVNKLSKLITDN